MLNECGESGTTRTGNEYEKYKEGELVDSPFGILLITKIVKLKDAYRDNPNLKTWIKNGIED